MRFSQRMSKIKPSATLAMNARTLAMRAKGIAVTSLAVGEPDFLTPEHVKAAAQNAIHDNFTHYTAVPGIPELREAVSSYYHHFYGIDPAPDAVIIENGGKQALYNLFMALLNPDDEVLVPAPYWVSYPDMIHLAGGIPVFVKAKAEQHFRLSPTDLEAARTAKTRILIFNSPANPTGAFYPQHEVDAIMQWAHDHDIFVIADEIYDQLVYPPAEPASIAKWWQQYPENFAITNGVSKTFAMTGWRVGYTLASPELIKILSRMQGQTTSNVCSVAQKAALAALTGSYACIADMRRIFQRRRDLAWQEIASWPGVICPKPDGAFYIFADMSVCLGENIPDAPALCDSLLERVKVALVSGDAFGAPGCVRFSYAVDEKIMLNALARIRSVLFPQEALHVPD